MIRVVVMFLLFTFIGSLMAMKKEEAYDKQPPKPLRPGVTSFDEYIAKPNDEGPSDEDMDNFQQELEKQLDKIYRERRKKNKDKRKVNSN